MKRYSLRVREPLAIDPSEIRHDEAGFYLTLGDGPAPENETRGSVTIVKVRGALCQYKGDGGDSYEGIVERVREVDHIIAEIATASQEQTQGIGQVNTAVSEIDRVTQAVAGNAEETAAAAEQLNAQSGAMQDAVGQLRAVLEGQGAAARPAASVPLETVPVVTPRLIPSRPKPANAPAVLAA